MYRPTFWLELRCRRLFRSVHARTSQSSDQFQRLPSIGLVSERWVPMLRQYCISQQHSNVRSTVRSFSENEIAAADEALLGLRSEGRWFTQRVQSASIPFCLSNAKQSSCRSCCTNGKCLLLRCYNSSMLVLASRWYNSSMLIGAL